MPIVVAHSPSAAAVGTAGFLGGRGDYGRYLRQQALRELQNQQQVALQLRQQDIGEANNMRSLWTQQVGQALAAQTALQRQRMDIGADRQRMVLGAGLDAQRMQRQALLGNWSNQQEQERRFQLMQLEQELQTNPLADRRRLEENMALLNHLPNARGAWQQENQQALDQGMQLTPEDQKRFTKLAGDLEFLTKEKDAGRLTDMDYLTGGRKLFYDMMSIKPSQKPPSPEEMVKQRVGWVTNPITGEAEGFVIDRYGVPKQLRPKVAAKDQAQELERKRIELAAKREETFAKQQAAQQERRAEFVAKMLASAAERESVVNEEKLWTDAERLFPDPYMDPATGRISYPRRSAAGASLAVMPSRGALVGGVAVGSLPTPALPPSFSPGHDATAAGDPMAATRYFSEHPERATAAEGMRSIIARYGNEPSRWPPEVRAQYLEFNAAYKGVSR